MKLTVNTPEKARLLRNWLRVNEMYHNAPETLRLQRENLNCPNGVCADTYRQLLEGIKNAEPGKSAFDDVIEVSKRWKRLGKQCPLCLVRMKRHEKTRVFRMLRRARKAFEMAFGITPKGALREFSSQKERQKTNENPCLQSSR